MSEKNNDRGHGFGTWPVFLAGISTILGAIMFLRFGYAVGNVGLLGAMAIILIGHLVTIPTALALAEIATNRRVEGGGEYFIISRSFGKTIGSVIGISLYLSQAVSVAFYMIAFAEAFTPLKPLAEQYLGFWAPQIVSLPATLLLIVLMLTKGANLGVKALYVVVTMLAISLVMFFLGGPVDYVNAAGQNVAFVPDGVTLTQTVPNADAFFIVFAIVFPAFTGMTAGVGLSGDLANPRKSIPAGTLAATITGMLMYVAIMFKLAYSAPLAELDADQLIMQRIALFGDVVPSVLIGLGFATLSSAIGSILVAPRTLQALGADNSIPMSGVNRWLARGVGKANEPRNATLITGSLAVLVVVLGNVDFVARLISMFFMITYGSLCAISFLEHFAARPSYRPSFKSRWYVSLFGAVICLLMMFQMDPVFAILSLLTLGGLYTLISRTGESKDDLAAMFAGVLTQLTRYLHLRLQSRRTLPTKQEWRPSVIMVDGRTFDRRSPLEFLRWISHRHGFGTYLHYIQDQLNVGSYRRGKIVKQRLITMAEEQRSTVYMDTIISPSMISALAQSLQVPGISGLNNNTVLFEFSIHDDETVRKEVLDSSLFSASTRMTLLVLRHGDFFFGERSKIHVWLTWNDSNNANLMILLGYILVGHPDWEKAEIRVHAALPKDRVEEQRSEFEKLISEGRLPVSEKNIRYFPVHNREAYRTLVERESQEADLTIFGFGLKGLRERGVEVFEAHPGLNDVLFVHAPTEIKFE